MKVLSLALVGLCGYAGSALAACPAGPDQANGGAWTAVSQGGGSAAVVAGGLDGSECRLDAKITANVGSASAFVRDDSPNNEPHYRAQFKINSDALSGQSSSQPVRVFLATTDNAAFSVPQLITLTTFGNATGTARILGVSTVCDSSASHVCANNVTLNPTGTNTIELEWQKGTTGGLKIWINSGTEASPTFSATYNNDAWGGVDSVALGLAAAGPTFRTNQLGKAVGFDRFDSRRQTFIGSP